MKCVDFNDIDNLKSSYGYSRMTIRGPWPNLCLLVFVFSLTEATFKKFPSSTPINGMHYEGLMKLVSIMTITVD